MDNSFISKDNIDNIYENINVHFVKNYNYNLNSYDKYKKIIKKLSKTIFNNIKNNNTYINITPNEFHDIVLNNSVTFLLNDITTKKRKNEPINIKSSNSGLIESTLLNDINNNVVEDSSTKTKRKSKKVTYNPNIFNQTNELSDVNTDQPHFADTLDDYNKLIKEANKKIKDNFNKIIEDNNSDFKSPILNPTIHPIDENKDNLISLKSNKLAFEEILEEKLGESDKEDSLYDSYNNSKMRDIISSVVFKQKDNSKGNKLESYEGEEYLPNLIEPVGEQAPIQPLIYQNTGSGTERIDKKIITVDSGTASGGANDLSSTSVTNNGTNYWYRFRVDLQDNVKIDKLCDVYLRNITVIGITSNTTCNYLVIDVDEFNIRNYSNNPYMRNKIIISNTITASSDTSVLNINYSMEQNYITTINPSKLTDLSFTITNQDGDHADSGVDSKTFNNQDLNTNRIIFEFEFKSRGERDDLIIEKNMYTN